MPTQRLTWLEGWILYWLRAEARRSQALLAASHAKLLDGFAPQEQERIRAGLAYLETKGLIVVGRTPGGKPAYLVLTPTGSQCISRVPRRLDV
jgi:hypothetical protein